MSGYRSTSGSTPAVLGTRYKSSHHPGLLSDILLKRDYGDHIGHKRSSPVSTITPSSAKDCEIQREVSSQQERGISWLSDITV